jgi:CMP-2-keto-3-deoxyoctulosonic acid synthetase
LPNKKKVPTFIKKIKHMPASTIKQIAVAAANATLATAITEFNAAIAATQALSNTGTVNIANSNIAVAGTAASPIYVISATLSYPSIATQ